MMGDIYGRLTAIEEVEPRLYKSKTLRQVRCRCSCGTILIVALANLKSGNSKSCGCLAIEKMLKRKDFKRWPKDVITSNHKKYYSIWFSMKDRCNNKYNSAYNNYGGRGISVCQRWMGDDGFSHFLKDMGERPSSEHSIERRDNSIGYEPTNCYWATRSEQAANRRSCSKYKAGSEIHNISQWVGILGTTIFKLRKNLANNLNDMELCIKSMYPEYKIKSHFDKFVNFSFGHTK